MDEIDLSGLHFRTSLVMVALHAGMHTFNQGVSCLAAVAEHSACGHAAVAGFNPGRNTRQLVQHDVEISVATHRMGQHDEGHGGVY